MIFNYQKVLVKIKLLKDHPKAIDTLLYRIQMVYMQPESLIITQFNK
jgi:hypothetical protein